MPTVGQRRTATHDTPCEDVRAVRAVRFQKTANYLGLAVEAQPR
ncbi:MAG: hypothetical protein WCP01_10685 [Methylococcaceae bacterium]